MAKKLPNISGLAECPHCGADEFYIYQRVAGLIGCRYRFDGDEADNSEMHSGINYGKPQSWVFCGNCQERIARNDKYLS